MGPIGPLAATLAHPIDPKNRQVGAIAIPLLNRTPGVAARSYKTSTWVGAIARGLTKRLASYSTNSPTHSRVPWIKDIPSPHSATIAHTCPRRHFKSRENIRHLPLKKKLLGSGLAKNYFPYSLNSKTETILDLLMLDLSIDVWLGEVKVSVKFCYNHLTNASGLGDNVRHDLEKGKKQAKEAARFIKTKKRPVGDR